MKSTCLKIVCLFAITSSLGFGQIPVKQSYFGIRGGYQRVATDVFISALGNTYTTKGYAPRNTFYSGVFYQQNLSQRLLYRMELNYQQKGLEHHDQDGSTSFQKRLHYVGLTPLIGFNPITNLSLLVGPEANWLAKNSSPSPTSNTRTIEVGLTARVAYRYKWIGFEVGYFRAFNEYSDLSSPIFGTKFKSRTWQAGLFLIPGKLNSE